MKCIKCDNVIETGKNYCSKCGTPVDATPNRYQLIRDIWHQPLLVSFALKYVLAFGLSLIAGMVTIQLVPIIIRDPGSVLLLVTNFLITFAVAFIFTFIKTKRK